MPGFRLLSAETRSGSFQDERFTGGGVEVATGALINLPGVRLGALCSLVGVGEGALLNLLGVGEGALFNLLGVGEGLLFKNILDNSSTLLLEEVCTAACWRSILRLGEGR